MLYFSVKGQTVTPQLRPPHGPQPIPDAQRNETAYKGTMNDNTLFIFLINVNAKDIMGKYLIIALVWIN